MKKLIRRDSIAKLALMCFAIFGPVSSAQAALILDGYTANTGTGFGNTFNILSLQDKGKDKDGSETGAVISVGGSDEFSGETTNQSQTRTLAEMMVTDPSQFRLLFDANEPGNASEITINALTVSFYDDTDGLIFFQDLEPAPLIFSSTNTGNGIDDAIFRLDADGISAAQAAFQPYAPIGNIRVGVSATLTNAASGADSFAGGMVMTVAEVPEPTMLALLGIGLLGAGTSMRRRKRDQKPL